MSPPNRLQKRGHTQRSKSVKVTHHFLLWQDFVTVSATGDKERALETARVHGLNKGPGWQNGYFLKMGGVPIGSISNEMWWKLDGGFPILLWCISTWSWTCTWKRMGNQIPTREKILSFGIRIECMLMTCTTVTNFVRKDTPDGSKAGLKMKSDEVNWSLLLIEEILHQLIGSLSHYWWASQNRRCAGEKVREM